MFDPTEFGDEWQKETVYFCRGMAYPVRAHERGGGDTTWHSRRPPSGTLSSGVPPGEARARMRDETGHGQAAAIAAAMLGPALPHEQPVYAVEVERLAAACYGILPLPVDYSNATGQPSSAEELAYQAVRGAGDGRRVPWHVVPKLCAPRSGNDVNRTWRRVQPERVIPTVSARGLRLGERVAQRRRKEAAKSGGGAAPTAHEVPTVSASAAAAPTTFIVPVTRGAGGIMLLLPAFSDDVIGYVDQQSAGSRGPDRAAATAAEEAVMRKVCPPEAGSAPRLAPAAYPVVDGHSCVVMTAFVSPTLLAALALVLARRRLRDRKSVV